MANEKNASSHDGVLHIRPTPVERVTGIAKSQRARKAELITLEIDDDYDTGSDPYNCTGSHCVVKLRDDAERE